MGYIRGEQLCVFEGFQTVLEPYLNLAQFAAIFLTYPEVMLHFKQDSRVSDKNSFELFYPTRPTQENILDEIIVMNGVDK